VRTKYFTFALRSSGVITQTPVSITTEHSSMTDKWESMKRAMQVVRRWLALFAGSYRCASCTTPLRRLVIADLTPEAVRTHRLAGKLGGLLTEGYVCPKCTKPGEWILIH
jgi:hypothetical protein